MTHDPDAVTLHEGRVWYGSAGGYGYDKRAAALQGHPIGAGLVATDHCGLDRVERAGTDIAGVREIIVHRGRRLPRGLFTV